MGFWDAQVQDLAVAGVRLSPEEVDVLENGGEVMCLIELPDPAVYMGYDGVCIDVNGDDVLVPVQINCTVPTETHTPAWKHNGAVTIVDQMDHEYGKEWRNQPAYIGEMLFGDGDRWGQFFSMYVEELRLYRPWTCRPLTSTYDLTVMARLQEYSRLRLEDAKFFHVEEVAHIEAMDDGSIDLEAACIDFGLVTPPEGYTNDYLGSFENDLEWDEAWIRSACAGFAELCNAGIVFCWSWTTVEDRKKMTDLQVPPMELFIPPDDIEAYEMWFSTVAKRSAARRKLANFWSPGNARKYYFEERHIA